MDTTGNYQLRIPNAIGGSQQGALTNYTLAMANIGGAGQPNVRDSDGTLSGNDAIADVDDLDKSGVFNHTYDFGFYQCISPVIQFK